MSASTNVYITNYMEFYRILKSGGSVRPKILHGDRPVICIPFRAIFSQGELFPTEELGWNFFFLTLFTGGMYYSPRTLESRLLCLLRESLV